MTFDAILLTHARTRPSAPAIVCAYRTTSYRKLASRVERATARLQTEWNVAPGDVVAYAGSGHQDAIVLFLALIRCGAHLVIAPLGGRDVQASAACRDLLGRYGTSLVLNDDGSAVRDAPSTVRIMPLHAIIATPCPLPATVVQSDPERLLLRCVVDSSDDASGAFGGVRSTSAAALFRRMTATSQCADVAASRMFDDDIFAPIVLSTLAGGGVLSLTGGAAD